MRYEHFHDTYLRNVKLKEGLVFANLKVFKDVVHEYGIKNGKSIIFPCNEEHRVRGVCKGKARQMVVLGQCMHPPMKSTILV